MANGQRYDTDLVVELPFSFGAGTGGTKSLPTSKGFVAQCYVLRELQHDVVLGMAFLNAHNPSIDFASACMTFADRNLTVCASRVGKPRIELVSIQQLRHTLRWDRNACAFLGLVSTQSSASPAGGEQQSG